MYTVPLLAIAPSHPLCSLRIISSSLLRIVIYLQLLLVLVCGPTMTLKHPRS